MDPLTLRIIDANLNRAREGCRVLEEYARLALNDAALAGRAKSLRHALAEISRTMMPKDGLQARDIHGDVGTELTTEAEHTRAGLEAVARAAAKRLAEALRCVEEYGKILSPSAAGRAERLRYQAYALEADLLSGGPRRARLRRARMHVLVTEALCAGPWLDVCEQALHAGADVLQLREKTLGDRELLARAKALRELTRRHGALLIINDRPDIARLADADGVHLGREDLAVSEARAVVGPQRLIGKSTHGVEEARAALIEAPDYLGVGPMFASETKPDLIERGLKLFLEVGELQAPGVRETGAREAIPLVAIGGMTAERTAELAGAVRNTLPWQVAVCRAVIAAADPAAATRAIRDCLSAGRDGTAVHA